MTTILVIDDEQSLRDLIFTALQSEGFEVLQAKDGLSGVEVARKALPDLIMCDILMPTLDGYETLKILREDPVTATIPFIFLTGHAEQGAMRHGMDLGADDFLTKPFSIPELLNAVRARLEKQRLYRQQTERKLDELRVSLSLSLPHEIRTPLSGIVGFAEVLRDDSGTLKPSEISEMADMILKSASRLGHLVENVLTYAQLELLAADPKRRELIRKETTSMLDMHIEEVAQKKAREYDRLNDLVLQLSGGEAALSVQNMKRIVEELADNAFKFSATGTPVEIATRRDDTFHVLTVCDRGMGMEARQIAEIGAYRQFNRKRLEQQGSGLGLAITKRLAEIYRGMLSFQSEPGKGTTAEVRLPSADLG
ncbi:MAG: hybrid sensor histidine kinase/response regulator [Ignavibacteria bacterium]|nr:hybrid sensor histidine kinase/response regulator [Ignavibacteria bacterium]